MNCFDDVISCCRDLLINYPGAKNVADYANNRLSKCGQEVFSFGYFPPNDDMQILTSVVGEECLKKLDLIYPLEVLDGASNRKIMHSMLRNHNLVMPYRDAYGNIVAVVGRSILDDNARSIANIPKYKNTYFLKRNHLFGLYEGKKSIVKNNLVYIVEGQFDCITAHDKGLTNVVALGSSGMTFEQFAFITRYTDNIVLLLDNDNAGKAGTERILKLYSHRANIKNAKLPDGIKDIDEFLSNNSVEDLQFVIK